jgi:hypothetical protein
MVGCLSIESARGKDCEHYRNLQEVRHKGRIVDQGLLPGVLQSWGKSLALWKEAEAFMPIL